MIEYFNANQHAFWVTVGFALLIIEAVALGFSTGVLLFSALGALVTGGLLWAGVLPDTWLAGTASFGVSSAVLALLLWKPLLKLQNYEVPDKDNSSDLVGLRFVLKETVTRSQPGSTRYSGIDWRVEIDPRLGIDQIDAGTPVAVMSVEVGLFRIMPDEGKEPT